MPLFNHCHGVALDVHAYGAYAIESSSQVQNPVSGCKINDFGELSSPVLYVDENFFPFLLSPYCASYYLWVRIIRGFLRLCFFVMNRNSVIITIGTRAVARAVGLASGSQEVDKPRKLKFL